jgi:hypothetical protein
MLIALCGLAAALLIGFAVVLFGGGGREIRAYEAREDWQRTHGTGRPR